MRLLPLGYQLWDSHENLTYFDQTETKLTSEITIIIIIKSLTYALQACEAPRASRVRDFYKLRLNQF